MSEEKSKAKLTSKSEARAVVPFTGMHKPRLQKARAVVPFTGMHKPRLNTG